MIDDDEFGGYGIATTTVKVGKILHIAFVTDFHLVDNVLNGPPVIVVVVFVVGVVVVVIVVFGWDVHGAESPAFGRAYEEEARIKQQDVNVVRSDALVHQRLHLGLHSFEGLDPFPFWCVHDLYLA